MKYKEAFSFGVKWNFKTISTFIFLLIIPNLLGMMNVSTSFGFKIHFFQLAVFIAALLYGPSGGFLSGFVGSLYAAMVMGNPYIAVGNALLGFFVGLFARFGWHTILSVLGAYIVQLPWLIFTDYYLMNLSTGFIQTLVVALFISNIVWAFVAHHSIKPIKKALKC